MFFSKAESSFLQSHPSSVPRTEMSPEDLEEEELAAYAEECALHADMDTLDELPEDWFDWNDAEEDLSGVAPNTDQDISMSS